MRFALLCKRYYTNRDLFSDRFGRLYHLPFQLARLGHSGIVIAADYRSKHSDGFAEPRLEFCSIPFSIVRSAWFVAAAYRAISRARPSVILASGDIHFGALGLLFARRLGVPLVFDVYDDYGVFASGKIPGMRALFTHTLRRADVVVSASDPLAQRLRMHNSAVIVIENGVDPAQFRPIEKAQARTALGINDAETVIGFFGSIAANRGVEYLIEASRAIARIRPNTRLLLAGANTLGLNLAGPGIDYRGMVPQHDVPTLINACDVVVIPYLPDPQVDMSNACKIAEYVACGVPVVTTRVSNFANIFAAVPQAVCEPADVESMTKAIWRQLEQPQRLLFREQDFSWQGLAEKLAKELERLLPV